jgi:hypothetical protein
LLLTAEMFHVTVRIPVAHDALREARRGCEEARASASVGSARPGLRAPLTYGSCSSGGGGGDFIVAQRVTDTGLRHLGHCMPVNLKAHELHCAVSEVVLAARDDMSTDGDGGDEELRRCAAGLPLGTLLVACGSRVTAPVWPGRV